MLPTNENFVILINEITIFYNYKEVVFTIFYTTIISHIKNNKTPKNCHFSLNFFYSFS